jgi:hypothetical protein
VINDLGSKAPDFEFPHSNLRNAVAVSGLLTPSEKRDLNSVLDIAYVQSKR